MMKPITLFLLLFLYSCAEKPITTPMLWEINAKHLSQPSYIFGTYHTRDSQMNKLPKVVYTSLSSTQRFYTEIQMDKRSATKVGAFSKLTHPKSLKKRLHPKTFKKLLAYLIKNKVPLRYKDLAQYKTWGIALLLGNQQANKEKALFMDENLALYAKEKHIKKEGLETVLEQLHYFDVLPKALQEQLLVETLTLKDDTRYTQALESWYIQGEAKGFLALQKRFTSTDPKQQKLDKVLFEGLLLERNARFTKRMTVLLRTQPQLSYFFAIGAGHLSGKKGILSKLAEAGYMLKKLD